MCGICGIYSFDPEEQIDEHLVRSMNDEPGSMTQTTLKKLVVLPNDPIYKYYEKGEIKPRYFNPGNYFDEVHLLSLCDQDIAPERVQTLAGNAKLCIHPIGRPTPATFPFFFPRVKQLVRQLAPDVIRAYNPRQCGSLAAYAGKRLQIPSVLSIHLEYDDQRRYDHRLLLRLMKPLERYALCTIDAVICVTDYLQRYARKYGAKRCVTIYNRVYTDQFCPSPEPRPHETCTILSVGRLDRQKYQECLIRAVRNLDVRLVLIGQGELEVELKKLTKELDINQRVTFISSVPNTEIQTYYWRADVFALATHYEGFCIPVLEAMAAGLPVVASNTPPIPEILGRAGRIVENTPQAFEAAFRQLIKDRDLRRQVGQRARERAETLDGTIMEQREKALYESLIQQDPVTRHNRSEVRANASSGSDPM
jgi:glycosyltransferase involved in cell wall biosynthesis